jgi:signal transduction histidine kinase
VATQLTPSARVPVYVLGSWLIGSGTVGGSVVDLAELGKRVAAAAVSALHHEPAQGNPVEVLNQGKDTLDWRALQHWGIDMKRVPPDAVIRYQPTTVWEEHRRLILVALGIILAQTISIFGLLNQRKRRRRAEVQMLAQQTELAHATRVSTVGQLSFTVIHELSQPLGSILRNAETAEILLAKDQPHLGKIRSLVEEIRKDEQRAGDVINRMRALLQKRELTLAPANLKELLAETIGLIGPDARRRKIGLSLQIADSLPQVRGDRVHLQQVLLNLLLKGIEATSEAQTQNPQLTVRAVENINGFVEVTVSDHGPGISPELLDHLFEPYATTKAGGLGLGLSISKHIIEAHGGKIFGKNKPAGGADFTFTLPACER